MPTTGLRFAPTFQAQTPIGAALQNIGTSLFGGPTAFQREAALAQAERARVAAEIEQRKLTGMDTVAGLIESANGLAKYAPGNPRDPKDPNWETNAGSSADLHRRLPGEIAAASIRAGLPISEAAAARVLAYSSPNYRDSMRTDAYVGTGKALAPYGAFSEKGQFAAEGRETSSKARIAATGAAAANPDKYQIVREREAILKGQPANSPDRRALALGEKPTTEMLNKQSRAANLGFDLTEMEQHDQLESTLSSMMRGSPSPNAAMKEFERAVPGGVQRLAALKQKAMDYQNSPRVIGQQRSVAPSGQMEWTVPSEVQRGVQVPAWRGDDGQWYKQEADGKTYILKSRNY